MWVIYKNGTGEFYGYGRLSDYPNLTGYTEVDAITPPLGESWDWLPDKLRFKVNLVTTTTRDFLNMFTMQERIAFRELAKTDVVIDDYLWILSTTSTISANDPSTPAGLGYLLSVGILTTDRYNSLTYNLGLQDNV